VDYKKNGGIKMKNWKRVLSVLLAVVLVGTMVSGLALAEEKTEVKVPYKSIKVDEDAKKQEWYKGNEDELYYFVSTEYEDVKIDYEKQKPVWDHMVWTSSDSSVVVVDKYGNFKARKAGEATITVASYMDAKVNDTFKFTVKEGKPVTSVSLSTTSFEVAIGEEVDLWDFMSYEPSDAWWDRSQVTSSDPEILRVNGTRLRGLKAGNATATLTITNEDGSSVSTKASVTVTEQALKSLKFSKSSVTIKKLEKESLYLGNYLTVEPANADIVNLKWESSNEQVAWIEGATVYAGRPGTATITVKSKENPSIKAEIEVKVVENNAAIDKLKFDDKTITLYFIKKDGKESDDRNSKYVELNVQPYEATDTIKSVTWTSSDANVAIPVDAGSVEGTTVKAVGKGTCTITVYVKDMSGNKYNASFKVKVKEKSATAKLNKTEITLRAGKKKTLKATDADSKVKLEGKWSSSDKSVAKVDKKTGKVTAVGEGRAIITFKPTNKAYKSVTCVVNVKPAE
jgi:uncharacterized protein YjdB